MKFLFLFFAFFVAAQATVLDNRMLMRDDTLTVRDDHLFWTRHMKMLKLFNHYTMINANVDQVMIAKNFKLDTLLDICDDKIVVQRFLTMLNDDTCIVKKNEVFSITNKMHRDNVKIIVDIFLRIKNFDYFYDFACWVREYMNHDLFLYTISIAMLHRDDCRGMLLPKMYEIVPNKFFNDEVIEIVKRIKMQGGIFDVKTADRMGVKKIDDRTFLINTFYSCWFLDTNEECKMSYFTEDVDLNNVYFKLHLWQPFWMHSDMTNDLFMKRRGEYFLFVHKQLLNRYYLERLSNGLGRIPMFKYDLPIVTGMTTTLKHFNGLIMPSRPNNFLVNTIDNIWELKMVKDYERRLRDFIDKGYMILDDGRTLYMNKPEDIELLGNIIESTADCPNRKFFLNGLLVAKHILGNGLDTTNKIFAAPAILEQFETALRDPMFWQLWKRIYHYVLKFKYNLRPYTYREVGLDGVVINRITTDRLETFFDTCLSDISNVVNRDIKEMTVNRDRFTFITRQRCLNHRKFNVNIDYTSDKTMDVMVKIFLGPNVDDRKLTTVLMEDFLQLDHFMVNLKTGQNMITRESTQMWHGIKDMTYTKLMDRVEKCMTTGGCVKTDVIVDNIVNRLLLPKGKKGGMMYKLFVTITPLKKIGTLGNNMMMNMFVDGNAFGYPIDRKIDWTVFVRCTNMMLKDVVIYHDVTTDIIMDKMMMHGVTDRDLMMRNVMDKDLVTRNYMTKDMMMDRMLNTKGMWTDKMNMNNMWTDKMNMRDNMWTDKMNMNNMWTDKMNMRDNMWTDKMNMRDNMWTDKMNTNNMWTDKMNMRDNMWTDKMNMKDNMWTDKMNMNNMWTDKMNMRDNMWTNKMNMKDNMWTDKMNMNNMWTDKMNMRDNMWTDKMNMKDNMWTDKMNMKDMWMDKDIMNRDFMTKRFMNKDIMDRDYLTTDKNMRTWDTTNDYMNRDLMNKHLMDKDIMNKHLMDKDIMNKHLMDKDIMNKHLMDKDIINVDLMNKDFMNKHLMDKDVMNRNILTTDNMRTWDMTNDYMNRDLMKKSMMNKDNMMNRDYMTMDYMTKDRDIMNKDILMNKDRFLGKDYVVPTVNDNTKMMDKVLLNKDTSYERRW